MDRLDLNKSGIIIFILKEFVYVCCGNCIDYGIMWVDFDYIVLGCFVRKLGFV